jgi:hypothetical protein
MTCCVIALALAMQIIESWRRFKAWAGIVDRAELRGEPLGVRAANLAQRLKHPLVKYAVATLIVVESAAAGAWAYGHRNHVESAVGSAIYSATGFALALCDGTLP